jgi:hypothetical protein
MAHTNLPLGLQEILNCLSGAIGEMVPAYMAELERWVWEVSIETPYLQYGYGSITLSQRDLRLVTTICSWAWRHNAPNFVASWDRERNLPTSSILEELLFEELEEAREWEEKQSAMIEDGDESDFQNNHLEMVLELADNFHIISALMPKTDNTIEQHVLNELLLVLGFVGKCHPTLIIAAYLIKYALVRTLEWSFKDHYLEHLLVEKAKAWAYNGQTLEKLFDGLTENMQVVMQAIVILRTKLPDKDAQARVEAHIKMLKSAMEE